MKNLDYQLSIIDYLLSDVFNCFGITMSNLKKYSLVKNRIPVGLNNIIHQLTLIVNDKILINLKQN